MLGVDCNSRVVLLNGFIVVLRHQSSVSGLERLANYFIRVFDFLIGVHYFFVLLRHLGRLGLLACVVTAAGFRRANPAARRSYGLVTREFLSIARCQDHVH